MAIWLEKMCHSEPRGCYCSRARRRIPQASGYPVILSLSKNLARANEICGSRKTSMGMRFSNPYINVQTQANLPRRGDNNLRRRVHLKSTGRGIPHTAHKIFNLAGNGDIPDGIPPVLYAAYNFRLGHTNGSCAPHILGQGKGSRKKRAIPLFSYRCGRLRRDVRPVAAYSKNSGRSRRRSLLQGVGSVCVFRFGNFRDARLLSGQGEYDTNRRDGNMRAGNKSCPRHAFCLAKPRGYL